MDDFNAIQRRFAAQLQPSVAPVSRTWGPLWAPEVPRPVTVVQLVASVNRFAYPIPNVPPVKRKRTFEVRMVPASTLAATLELIADVNPALPAAISNTLEFEKFVSLNDRPAGTVAQDFLLLLFAIDIQLQGLGAGTTKTYMRSILGGYGRAQKPIWGLYPTQGPYIKDLFKIQELLISHEEVDHAKDMDLLTAAQIIGLLTGAVQATAWLMLMTGARVADLLRLYRDQFLFEPATLKILFKYTKGRRSEKKAYTLALPYLKEFPIPLSVQHALNVAPKAIVCTVGVDEFNAALKLLGEKFEGYTSYSFRRLFVHRVIERFTSEDCMVAWAEVVKLTGHVSIETVRTSYAKKFTSTL